MPNRIEGAAAAVEASASTTTPTERTMTPGLACRRRTRKPDRTGLRSRVIASGMRILVGLLVLAAACGGPKAKRESSLVNEGSDAAPTCCCKTVPTTAEKEIVPNYAMAGRMECSTQQGECVDDVQCNGQNANASGTPPGTGGDGNPPPPPDLPKGD
jgi:hypothetical protein